MTEAAAAPAASAPAAPSAAGDPALAPSTPAVDGVSTPARGARLDRAALALAAVGKSQAGRQAPGGPAPAPVDAPKPDDAPASPPAAIDPTTQRALHDAIVKEREAYESKQRLKELEAQLKAAKEAEEGRKSLDPLALLAKERGLSYEQLTQQIVDGKYKPPTATELALEGTKSEVQQIKDELAALKAEKVKAAEEAERSAKEADLGAKLKAAAQHFPVLSAYDWAPRKMLELQAANPDASLDDIAAHLEKGVAGDLRKALSSEGALKALLAAEPELKAQVLSALGIKSDPLAQPVTPGKTRIGNGPDAVPSARASEPGTRSVPQRGGSTRDRFALAQAAVDTKRRASLG